MIRWTKKKYTEEINKGYWGDLTPHFNYYAMISSMKLFETFVKNNMSVDDAKSAMYGEFVCEGRPIKKGFYSMMNVLSEVLDKLIEKSNHTQNLKTTTTS